MLHEAPIQNAYWTHCRNFTNIHSRAPLGSQTPTGPIFASGRYEAGVGYVRIPWFGKIEPKFNHPVECWVCGRRVAGGIELRTPERTFGFCTNRHYIDWWKLTYEDRRIDSARLNTPEKFLREPEDD